VKSASQRDDIQQSDIAFPSFDASYIVAMYICQLRELLLRQTTLEPKLT
jgi:hypothetical protein